MMYKIVFVIIAGFILSAAHGEALSCPHDLSGDSLQDYRQSAIEKVIENSVNEVAQSVRTCFPGGPPRCLEGLKYYVDSEIKRNGFTDDDELNSTDSTEQLTVNSEKDLPPEFLVKNAYGTVQPGVFKIPDDILNLAKQKGWKAIAYKTRDTGGFDAAPNLLIVAIPSRDKDIFIQISPHPDKDINISKDDPNPKPAVGTLSLGQNVATIITLDKSQHPPVGQLRKMSGEDGHLFRWNNHLHSQGCTGCHTQPLRAISPRGFMNLNGGEKPLSVQDQQTVREINSMMEAEDMSWGSVKVGNELIHRGPKMDAQRYGWAPRNSPTRKDSFLNKCTDDAMPVHFSGFGNYSVDIRKSSNFKAHVDTHKVGAAMNCIECHNGTVRGPLHEGFNFKEITFKIMVDRSMPPGADLNIDERLALLSCLRKEFNEVRPAWEKKGEWLKTESCDSIQPSPTSIAKPGSK